MTTPPKSHAKSHAKSHGRLSIRASAKPRELMAPRPETKGAWAATVLTLYPEMFPGILGQSLTGKALETGLWHLNTVNIRDYARDKHRTVDDTPAGGGAGMVMKPDIIAAAIEANPQPGPILYLSPRGRPMTQGFVQSLSKAPGATLLCGRFEGVDQRVLDAYQIEEVSIGDYVLTGGELAAQVLIDATVRLIGGVLGNAESAENESFSNGLLEHPQYTRPSDWNGRAIPEVLLSGHHGAIAQWREDQSKALTRTRRPDLWRAYQAQHGLDADPGEDQELSDAATARDTRETKD